MVRLTKDAVVNPICRGGTRGKGSEAPDSIFRFDLRRPSTFSLSTSCHVLLVTDPARH